MMTKTLVLALVVVSVCGASTFAQEGTTNTDQTPISTQWVLDAAGLTQRAAIKSVFMIGCPKTNKKGTGFAIESGLIVTDNHVVEGCGASDLSAESSMGENIHFSKMVIDTKRDLALLKATAQIRNGLKLGTDAALKTGQTVTTWGFPLIYNGPAPLLSVGYLSGFQAYQIEDKTVKHLIVNGAFNPGNSGGPLLLSGENTVVGVVVWRMRILAPQTKSLIDSMYNNFGSGARLASGLSQTLPNGTTVPLSQGQVAAIVLQEFYDTVQVMIGEATSVSELKSFMAEKASELR